MLTLTRKVGEVIVVELANGEKVRLVVKEIDRNQVRLGVAASRTPRGRPAARAAQREEAKP